MQNDSVQRLKSRLGRLQAERRSILDKHRQEGRGDVLPDETDLEFRGLTADIRELEERIEELTEQEERAQRIHASAVNAGVYGPRAGQGESGVYAPESRHSYFADLLATTARTGDVEAAQRLQQYGQEARDLSRADGSGGFAVPPSWLMDEYIGTPRPGRVTADLLNRRPLPGGTDVINIPKLLTGTRVDVQPADNDPVVEQDPTDTSLSAPVRTIAGQVDVALQVIEQSPLNFDQILMSDLMADYRQRINLQVLSGTGTAGQLLGLRNVAGIETITWASASPDAAGLYRAVADAMARMGSSIFAAPSAIVMAPRRWAWLLTMNDTTGRPLVLPDAYNPSNARGLVTGGGAEGRVGSLAGLPVYVDGSIPTNVNIDQDVVLVLNTAETLLWESGVRTRVLPEVLSGTLTLRVQLYAYAAMITRQAKSISVITGSALAPPTFA